MKRACRPKLQVLFGDPHRVRQVLTNLTANAVKFTERGEVILEAAIESHGDHSATVRFAVNDTGIGIRRDRWRRYSLHFLRGTRLRPASMVAADWVVAICRHLVELMGGSISVDSVEGSGSSFQFTAVFEVAGLTPGQTTRDRDGEHSGSPATTVPKGRAAQILVAEDNMTNREVLLAQLEKLGFQANAATNRRGGHGSNRE